MKQLIRLTICFVLILGLVGCGLTDGVYRASFEEFDSHGYKTFLSVTVQDGVITAAALDAEDHAGGLKSQDTEYARRMQTVTGLTSEQISQQLTAPLIGEKRIKKGQPDAISGATISCHEYERLLAQVKQQLKKDDPLPATVPNLPEYIFPAASPLP